MSYTKNNQNFAKNSNFGISFAVFGAIGLKKRTQFLSYFSYKFVLHYFDRIFFSFKLAVGIQKSTNMIMKNVKVKFKLKFVRTFILCHFDRIFVRILRAAPKCPFFAKSNPLCTVVDVYQNVKINN